MKFRVIDQRTGADITNDHFWVLRPSGELGYMEYCDFTGADYAKAILIEEATK